MLSVVVVINLGRLCFGTGFMQVPRSARFWGSHHALAVIPLGCWRIVSCGSHYFFTTRHPSSLVFFDILLSCYLLEIGYEIVI